MLIAFVQRCFTVSLAMPAAHALSVWIGVWACGWPISIKAILSGMPSHALWNNVADDMTFRIMLLMVYTAPFCGGGVAGRGLCGGSVLWTIAQEEGAPHAAPGVGFG
jgi:hypothetical protein